MIKKYWYSSLKVPIFAPMINTPQIRNRPHKMTQRSKR